MITPEEFWTRLEAGQFVDSQKKLASIRKQLEAKPSVANSTMKIARILVSNKVITESQARSLLKNEQPDIRVVKSVAVDDSVHITSVQNNASDVVSSDKTKQSTLRLALVGGLAVLVLGAVAAFFLMKDTGSNLDPNPDTTSNDSQSPVTQPINNAQTESPYLLNDSTESLWARPDPGPPISFAQIPLGTQMIVRTRLSKLVETPSGRNLLKSFGPAANRILDTWTKRIGISSEDLETFTLYLLPQGTTWPEVIVEGKLNKPTASLVAKHGVADAAGITKLATDALWIPENGPNRFYFGKLSSIESMVRESNEDQTDGSKTDPVRNLRRELRQLVPECHDTDLITVLTNPNFLRDEAQGLFPGTRERLLEGLFNFWRDESQAVALGYQESAELAFLEVRMIAREELRPRVLAARVEQYKNDLPTSASNFLGRAELDPYWQPIALRFPAMLSFVAEQTHVVAEDQQVALNCVVPKEATHNLLLAAELSLGTRTRATVATQTGPSVASVSDLLASKTSVRFSQKSLDQAMKDVAQQIQDEFRLSIEIRLVGADLETEGITRNQQIRNFNATDLSVAEILTQLVMKANPDQSVTGPSDPQQKLIWLTSPDQDNLILISTREAASNKQLVLPSVFRP